MAPIIKWKLLSKIFIALAVGLLAFYVWQKNNHAQNSVHDNESKQSSSQISLDTTQDIAAQGYSGQRKIVFSDENTGYVAYRKKADGVLGIYIAKIKKSSDSNWQVDKINGPLNSKNNVTQRVPSLTIDGNKNIHVVWYGSINQDKPNNRQILYSRSTNEGQTWSKEMIISNVGGHTNESQWQEHPSIETGRDNYLFVVWEGKDGDHKHQQTKLSVSSDGGLTWQPWQNIQPFDNNTQSRPTIIQAPDGRLHVLMYAALIKKNQQIWHSSSTDKGASWSPWVNISRSINDSRHISLTAGESELYAVWRSQTAEKEKTEIVYASLNGENWSTPQVIAPSNAYQFFPSISISAFGQIAVTWSETAKKSDFPNERPKTGTVYLARWNKDEKTENAQIEIIAKGLYPQLPKKTINRQIQLSYTRKQDPYEIIFTNIQPVVPLTKPATNTN